MSKKKRENNDRLPVSTGSEEEKNAYPGKSRDTSSFLRLGLECLVIFMAAQYLGILVACVGYVCYVYSFKRWGLVKGIGYGAIGAIIAFFIQAFFYGQYLR